MDQIGDALEAITFELWEAMFDERFALATGGSPQTGRHRSCLVWIQGDPQRAVVAQFPEELAVALTTALLHESGVPDNAAVVDAVGEIGNILAGNIKTCFPQHATLSLPAVTTGTDFEISTVGTSDLVSRSFTTAGHVFVVTLLEADTTLGAKQHE